MTNEEHRQKCQAAVEKAIDAIWEVIVATECASDRYRDTLDLLREDGLLYQEEPDESAGDIT